MKTKSPQRRALEADLSEVERILRNLPPTSIINRNTYLARKKEIEESLRQLPEAATDVLSFQLTFQGDPVIANRGIAAEFGTDAVKRFAEAVSLFAAGSLSPLGSRGTVPNKQDYGLVITDVARGSFGFVLEAEWQMADDTALATSVSNAIDRIGRLISSSLQDSDEELAEIAAGVDVRAVNKLHDFLSLLVVQNSIFSLQGARANFSCKNMEQVMKSEMRLNNNNIVERTEWLEGEFSGVLPNRALFEFKMKDTGEFINGRIEEEKVRPEEIKEIVDHEIRIEVRSTKVGKGQPRYLLLGIGQVPTSEEQAPSRSRPSSP